MNKMLYGLVFFSFAVFAGDNVHYVERDDQEMVKAVENAKQSLDQFITALGEPRGDQVVFALKVRFTDQNMTEYMWLEKIKDKDGQLIGQLKNTPEVVTTVKKHQWLTVLPESVVDWMIVKGDGRVEGAYTTRVLRSRMTPEDRASFDERTGLDFAEVVQ